MFISIEKTKKVSVDILKFRTLSRDQYFGARERDRSTTFLVNKTAVRNLPNGLLNNEQD